jgi:CDP-diacylglycerol--glycerol-3-phosphate 3-phosphatidyltransferase/cardiolipin synthase
VGDAIRSRDLISVPGLLTLSRLGFAVVFPFVVNEPAVALAILMLSAASDMLDGWYARHFKRCSVTGAVLDPITDKVFAMSVVGSLILVGKLHVGWAVLLFVRELAELPLTIWLALDRRGKQVRAEELHSNLLGKATTGIQFLALVALVLNQRSIFFVALTTTAVLGAVAAWSYWRHFRKALATGVPSSSTS